MFVLLRVVGTMPTSSRQNMLFCGNPLRIRNFYRVDVGIDPYKGKMTTTEQRFRHLRYSEGRWFQERGIASSLVALRGLQRGQGSHANPAKRFVWEEEEQRNGRGLSAASGGQDEGMWSLFRRKSPLLVSFHRQRPFRWHQRKRGLNAAQRKPSVQKRLLEAAPVKTRTF